MSAIEIFRQQTGQELGVSAWLPITQDLVDQHAETTGDAQWIHNDPERATNEGPFGGPIAQGFFLLALFTQLAEGVMQAPQGLAYLINYGLDRVRFIRPVLVGDQVRLRLTLAEVKEKGDGRWTVTMDATLESQKVGETAVAARWLFLAQDA